MGVIFQAAGYTLRHIVCSDAPQVFERFTSDPKMMRYLPIKVHRNVDETRQLIEAYEATPGIAMSVLTQDAKPDVIVGLVGFGRHENAVALSLKVHRDGAGAGRVFAPRLVLWLLAHEPIYRVWAYTDVDNIGVANLLVKMGAKCEGTLRRYTVHPNISTEPRDCHVWSIIK
jgi:[ribosomal protein S5]-alanine N-acetyltransferase